jgi:hypothetical protein
MIRTLFTILGVTLLSGMLTPVSAQQGDAALAKQLDTVYQQWRASMIQKNLGAWSAVTATHRQTAIKNRIYSERRPLAATLFSLPAAPPDTRKLRMLDVKVKGATANAIYYGPVDFQVGGDPPNNLLVLSFVMEGARWKYDTADFVNLAALPQVRQQIEAGQLNHLKGAEFTPKGAVEKPMVELRGAVKYIAKTYVFCPGREVRLQVNKISRHLYQNTKESEVVIGGARDGRNEVQFAVKPLPGGQGNEPLAIRVYLLSQVQGVKPIKIFEYQVEEKGVVKPNGTEFFNVGPAEVKQLRGGR